MAIYLMTIQQRTFLKEILAEADEYSLNHGLSYYERKSVMDVTFDPHGASARVNGNAIYHVDIDFYTHGYMCSCPSWRHPCKHITAVCYALLKENPTSAKGTLKTSGLHGRLVFVVSKDSRFANPAIYLEGEPHVLIRGHSDIYRIHPEDRFLFFRAMHFAIRGNRSSLIPVSELLAESFEETRDFSLYTFINSRGEKVKIGEVVPAHPAYKEYKAKQPMTFYKEYETQLQYEHPVTKETRIQRGHLEYLIPRMFLNDDETEMYPLFNPFGALGYSDPLTHVGEMVSAMLTGNYKFIPPDVRRFIIQNLARHFAPVIQIIPEKTRQGMGIICDIRFGYAVKKKTIQEILEQQEAYVNQIEQVPGHIPPNEDEENPRHSMTKVRTDIFIPPGEPDGESIGPYVIEYHTEFKTILRQPELERESIVRMRQDVVYNVSKLSARIPPNRIKSLVSKYIIPFIRLGAIIQLDPKLEDMLWVVHPAMVIRPSQIDDWFEAQIEMPGLSDDDIRTVLEAYRKNQEYATLKSKRILLLANVGLDKFMSRMERFSAKVDSDGTLRLPPGAVAAMQFEEETNIRFTKEAKRFEEKMKSLMLAKQEAVKIPKSFKAKLRGYQKTGVNFLYHLYRHDIGGILADDMGLGKTIQVLALITVLKEEDPGSRFIVVAPVAALNVWVDEIRKFAPHLSHYVWHGSGRSLDEALEADLFLTSFGTLSQTDLKTLKQFEFTAAFIDEAQFIKNPETQAYKRVKGLKTNLYYCLTGTPLENYTLDLWAQFNLVFPGLLGSKKKFIEVFDRHPNRFSNEMLRRRISPFLLRRTKGQVLKELPPKTEKIFTVEMPKEQATLYEALRQEAVEALKTGDVNPLFVILPYLTRLRRVACHPDVGSENPDPEKSGKFRFLKKILPEMVDSASGVLVFSQFTSVLDILERMLDDMGVTYFRIDGSTSVKKRREYTEKFQAGERKLFLISLKAGGSALTLHRADTVIHLDPWWNPAAENQATDRAHRIGQDKPVFVYKVISQGTIEEKVLTLQKKKRALFDQILENKSTRNARITKEDLDFILRDAV